MRFICGGEAQEGVDKLYDGAGKLSTMSAQNQTKVGDIQRPLPPAHTAMPSEPIAPPDDIRSNQDARWIAAMRCASRAS